MGPDFVKGAGRRQFIKQIAAIQSGLVLPAGSLKAATPARELSTLRLDYSPIACLAPQYLAKELLEREGLLGVEFVDIGKMTGPEAIVRGRIDLTLWDVASTVLAMDAMPELRVLSGVHAGCWELVAHKDIEAIRDLKGRRIVVKAQGEVDYAWIAGALAYMGIDPRSEVRWIESGSISETMRIFSEGQADACLVTPPRDRQLREKGIGHVLINSTEDRPWSQYFCCMLVSSRRYITENPIAVKRFMRALYRAADLCSEDPEGVALRLTAQSWIPNHKDPGRVIRSIPYARWREDIPSDSLRFYGLRFHDAGMIQTHPNQLIARGADWRFLNALRQELKA